MNDLISVIVPIYNTGKPLKDCIESILAQDYPSIEIILVDDGSSDELTLRICDEYKNKHQAIKLIHQQNGGAAKARNTGIDNAQGEYIAFVDSDDAIDPYAYTMLHNAASKNKTPVVLGSLSIEGANQHFGNSGLPDGKYDTTTILSLFLQGYWCSACTNLYSKKIIGDFRFPVNEINEDYIFNFEIITHSTSFSIVNKPFYHYIRREDSVTSKPASLKHLDWVRHTTYIKDKTISLYGDNLKSEANYQYLYSNIVLCNKCIINIANGYYEEPKKLYKITAQNLRKEKCSILNNPHLNIKNRISGICIALLPNLYKNIATTLIKLRK